MEDYYNKSKFMEFNGNSKELTFGVELELQVLDSHSFNLVPRAHEVLKITSIKSLAKELFQSTIELITPICEAMSEAEDFFLTNLAVLKQEGDQLGLKFASTGTHPFANYVDRLITPSPRYQFIVSKNRWLIRRMAVYGMHVHLGMRNGEQCIQYHNFFCGFIPHLISLSASSPFWHGLNTELASCRPTMYEALPTAGIPYSIANWDSYCELVKKLMSVGSIATLKDLWWDIRPSPELGTLEIRVCDGPATIMELLAITAFIHALGHWFAENSKNSDPIPLWIIRENKWRAIRDGLSAEIIDANNFNIKPIKKDLMDWLFRLDGQFKKLGYEKYLEYLKKIIIRGNSSARQIERFNQKESLQEVTRMNICEFEVGHPLD